MQALRLGLVGLILLTQALEAAPNRSSAVRAAFVQENPCPVTGERKGRCPGWQVDHRIPLCAGGADAPHNMQWLTVHAHRTKTRTDRAYCRRLAS